MAAQKRDILWEVGCEGHVDAWVSAENWELATVEAAKFWGVPWGKVAALCECKQKIVGAPRNICCRCKRTYFGAPPLCGACREAIKTEEQLLRRARERAYRAGRLV